MNRDAMLARIDSRAEPWDIVVIGGGATGLGIAVDGAARGYDVALLEQADFAKGTSSRSTKLVHGGVRYLQQGNVSLVIEALRERGRLLRNAPHLVRDVPFVVPSYAWWESPFYGVGLKVYDMLAGKYGFGRSSVLSKDEVVEAIPSIRAEGLLGGTRYFDGQFDDARLAINLAATAADQGAALVNSCPVEGLIKDGTGAATGVRARDAESGRTVTVPGRVVVNATGAFADNVRRLDHADAEPIIAPSQGVHIVLGREFLPGETAIMVPHTEDGRVMFAIPWRGVTVVGTTDTPIERAELEPRALPEEIEFILRTANAYLAKPVAESDVRSVFVGVRPLVKAGSGPTAALSRDHTVSIDPASGLVTVAGGKWTTYRKMGEDVVDQCALLADLPRGACVTKHLPIHGSGVGEGSAPEGSDDQFATYGTDAIALRAMIDDDPALGHPVCAGVGVTGAEVVWACHEEMARTVEDVLSRRSRELIVDARAAREAAGPVARIMAATLGRDDAWVVGQIEEFRALAEAHLL